MAEQFGVHGIILLRKIPDEWTDEQFTYWYCPVVAPNGQVLQPARISDDTKKLWLAHEPVHNIITNTGINTLLTNTGVQSTGSMVVFSQILSVGNGPITGVTRGDTSVSGDGFGTNARKAPASHANTGFVVTITTNFATTDAQGGWTNIGLYGAGATGTTGSGSLMTHALFGFNKGAVAYAVDYVFVYSN